MYLLFYKGRGKLADWAIRLFTRSKYSHCEIAIPVNEAAAEYECYSSSARDGGTRKKRMRLQLSHWDIVKLDLGYPQEVQIMSWLHQNLGRPYGYRDLLAFVFPAVKTSKREWFCSEFCLAALQAGGKFEGANPTRTDPGELYKMVR